MPNFNQNKGAYILGGTISLVVLTMIYFFTLASYVRNLNYEHLLAEYEYQVARKANDTAAMEEAAARDNRVTRKIERAMRWMPL